MLETVGIELLQRLDVHEPVANLRVGVRAEGEEIPFAAFLLAARTEGVESAIRFARVCAERAPSHRGMIAFIGRLWAAPHL